MENKKFQLEIEDLCKRSQLGELLDVPVSISGGFLHRIYAIETTSGKYAIKLLNPHIMIRPTAWKNYMNSEEISDFVSSKIPALPAKKIDGECIQKINGQYFLVFSWTEGKSLKHDEIKNIHCEKIGSILADIHKTDFSELGLTNDGSDSGLLVDWEYYLQKGKENDLDWVKLLLENIENLKCWDSMAIEASKILASNMVISHRDLDSKNVLWNLDEPMIIDWESAGYINQVHDLIETAIYWSGNKRGGIDKERFFSFINGYKKRYGELHGDWRTVLENGFLSKLGWLEYNLKRSLWIECADEEEQQIGTIQVTETINEIRLYAGTIPKLLNWLTNEL
ncbi:phosphotransferase [Bacillus salitolerans]|uniref:Phosphotransferase n=1 Tax=Bacillus salitolerans TaxID=1437434 RepID=A0ABW4LVN0_9BACI